MKHKPKKKKKKEKHLAAPMKHAMFKDRVHKIRFISSIGFWGIYLFH